MQITETTLTLLLRITALSAVAHMIANKHAPLDETVSCAVSEAKKAFETFRAIDTMGREELAAVRETAVVAAAASHRAAKSYADAYVDAKSDCADYAKSAAEAAVRAKQSDIICAMIPSTPVITNGDQSDATTAAVTPQIMT